MQIRLIYIRRLEFDVAILKTVVILAIHAPAWQASAQLLSTAALTTKNRAWPDNEAKLRPLYEQCAIQPSNNTW